MSRLSPPASAPRALLGAVLTLLVAALAAVPTAPAGAGTHGDAAADRFERIDDYVRQRMNSTGTPGLAYAIVGPDGPVHERAWGHDGNGAPVDRDTPFLWGSVAKPVTSTAVMTLVEDGRVELDAPVRRYLPDYRVGGDGPAGATTVRQLLTQTSGLPESSMMPVSDVYGAGSADYGARLDILNELTLDARPGERHIYTSANYMVLGALVEAVTGRAYGDHLNNAVLRPAGMDGAIHDARSARERRLPAGHQRLWGRPMAVDSGLDTAGVSFGYLGGDLTDLAAFARLHLNDGEAGGGRVLSAESAEQAHKGTAAVDGGERRYGLGWYDGLSDVDTRAVWHGGATPGYATMLLVLPEADRAVVVQQNLYNVLQDAEIQEVGFGVARMVAGEAADEDDPEPADPTYPALAAAVTGAAIALLAGALRSAALLRNGHRRPTRPRWRAVLTACAWTLLGAVPLTAGGYLIGILGTRQALNWLPDITIATLTGCAAAVGLAALRVTRALRRRGAARSSHGSL